MTQVVIFMCMSGVLHAIRNTMTVVDSQVDGRSGAESANVSIDSDPGQQGSLAEVGNRNHFKVESDASINRSAENESVSMVVIKDGADVSVGATSSTSLPFVDCEGWTNQAWMDKLKNKSQSCFTDAVTWGQTAHAKLKDAKISPPPKNMDLRACSKKEMATMTATTTKCKPELAKLLPSVCAMSLDPEVFKGMLKLGTDCDTSASEATDQLMADLNCEGKEVINPGFSALAATYKRACEKAGITPNSVYARYPSPPLLFVLLLVPAPLI